MSMIAALGLLAAAGPVSAAAPPGHAPTVQPAQPVQHAPPKGGADASKVTPRFGFVTAAELAERCDGQSAFSLSYCYAYLAGVHDTLRAYEVWLGHPEFCAPPRATIEDTRRVLVAFLKSHPEYRDGQGASVSAVAMKDAYPCPLAAR